jgi:hypothetical protein
MAEEELKYTVVPSEFTAEVMLHRVTDRPRGVQ